MDTLRALPIPARLAGLAALCALLASVLGYVPGVYRDPHALVVQSLGQDLGTLVLALPILLIGLLLAARGSLRGRVLVVGAVGYLAYVYATYAFVAVIGPATVLHIATFGLATWALLLSPTWLGGKGQDLVLASHLPRRATAVFVLLVAGCFALLWLAQIAGAAISGTLPRALLDAGWTTSPIYTLDLAFVLPLMTVTGIRLLRREPIARVAVPLLVFTVLLAFGILTMTAFAAADGQTLEVVQVGIFVTLFLVGVALVARTLGPLSSQDGLADRPTTVGAKGSATASPTGR